MNNHFILPEVGHFNFPQIGHYHFRATENISTYPQAVNFAQAQNYLLSLQNLPRQEYMSDPLKSVASPRHCEVYLKRLQLLLDILGNPEKKIPHYIHVTGTSGKGSVCLFLHSILKSAGKKVGVSTSPHISSITERFTISGRQISKKEFIELVEFLKPKLDECARVTKYGMPSYFEVLEAITLLYFAREKVEWAIMEVGCGGRYDSSNIIPRKDVAIITNIGLDHVGIIGNNKAEIAYEKAGIIKPGCLVFTMEKDVELLKIMENEMKKYEKNINEILKKYYHLSRITYHVSHRALNKQTFKYQNNEYTLQCLGRHQIANAILAIEVARALKMPEDAIKSGLAKTKLPLRMEIVSKNPLIILDGAHNPDKMRTTIDSTDALQCVSPSNLHLIIGFSADKNISKMIKQLATLKPKTIACTRNATDPLRKVADPAKLAKQFKKLLPKTKIKVFLDPQTAFNWSKSETKTGDILLAAGSIYLSSEIKTIIQPTLHPRSP